VGLALASRLALARAAPVIEVDGAHWASLARALARGDVVHGLSPAWPPLYPWLVSLAARALAGAGAAETPALFERAARLVSAAAGTLILVPVWHLARRVAGLRAAWTAALLAAVHPRLLQYSAAALSETTFTLPLVAGVACLVLRAPQGPSVGRPGPAALLDAAGGIAFGLAFLVRPEGLPLGLVLWASAVALDGARAGRLRPLFLLGLAVTALPYLLYLQHELGGWSLGEKGPYNLWRAFAGEYARHFAPPSRLIARVTESRELTAGLAPQGLDIIGLLRLEPAAVLGRSAARLGTLVGSTLPVTLYLPFALLAAGGAWLRRGRVAALLGIAVGAACLLYAPFSVDRRFLVPLVPLGLVLAAAGLEGLLARGPAGAARWVLAAACAASLGYAVTAGRASDTAPEQRAAGDWLRAAWPRLAAADGAPHARPRVLARKPWVAYYGDGLMAELPEGSLDSVLARARARGADVLVADERSARSDRPALAALLEPGAEPDGLVPLWMDPGPPRVVLYDARPLWHAPALSPAPPP
jgi:4-amino-4-deoxy-L-arabinose transferase-like glycosyltransferase